MRSTAFCLCVAALFVFVVPAAAQKRRPVVKRPTAAARPADVGRRAVVIDERLSVLRTSPSLYSEPVQRMRIGREVQILGSAEADGVRFYRVTAPPGNTGWVQSDAVFGTLRPDDDRRMVRLMHSVDGFEQIEIARHFFKLFPNSPLRPSLLLLFGDLVDRAAVKLSKDAVSRLGTRFAAEGAAPQESYYLNYVGLDRYRKLGIVFRFNPRTRLFHYDGASWSEILKKHADTAEAAEAKKRLERLTEKLTAGR